VSAYLSEDEVLALRLQGIPVTGEPPRECCAKCWRGTRAHSTESSCGYNGRCDCHGRGYPTK